MSAELSWTGAAMKDQGRKKHFLKEKRRLKKNL